MTDPLVCIRHAAVKADDGQIFLGKSHAACFNQMRCVGYPLPKSADAQGFMTSDGKFVGRTTGAYIAQEAGQVSKVVVYLFSEDLWSPWAGGRFKYDYIRGYHE